MRSPSPDADGGWVLAQYSAWARESVGRHAAPSIIVHSGTPAILKPPAAPLLSQQLSLLLNPPASTAAQDLARVQKLRRRAHVRSDLPRSAAFAQFIFGIKPPRPDPSTLPPRDPSIGKHGKPRRPSGRHKPRSGKHSERAIEIKEDKANVSRSGRSVKTPSKYKEPVHVAQLQPGMRPQLSPNARKRSASGADPSSRPTPKSARSGARRPRSAASAGDDEGDDEDGFAMFSTESRLGEDFQAVVEGEPAPSSSAERGDVLLWSPRDVGAAGEGFALQSFMDEALPLLGGPPQNPPTQASSQREFATEVALNALHACRGDAAAAVVRLRASAGSSAGEAWSKVEERQLRAALAKAKLVDLVSLRESVRTKELGAVIRFFYVLDGQRKKAEREKQREVELLRLARSSLSQSAAKGGGGGGGNSTRASSPYSEVDMVDESKLEVD